MSGAESQQCSLLTKTCFTTLAAEESIELGVKVLSWLHGHQLNHHQNDGKLWVGKDLKDFLFRGGDRDTFH